MRNITIQLCFLFVVYFGGCSSQSCEDNIIDVEKISDSLYCEEYLYYSGGVYGGDIIYSYITDSILFRKYVGKYDDNSVIFYKVLSNNDIKAYKVTDKGLMNHQYDTVLLKSYSLSSLKKEYVFEKPCKHYRSLKKES